MSVILDTCVLSELQNRRGDAVVKQRILELSARGAAVSVISLGELTKGVEKLAPGKKRKDLRLWLDGLIHLYQDTTLGIDREIAEIWGQVTARAAKAGQGVSAPDGLIAATAIRHGLAVMTRNVSDFESTGVRVVNPWEG